MVMVRTFYGTGDLEVYLNGLEIQRGNNFALSSMIITHAVDDGIDTYTVIHR